MRKGQPAGSAVPLVWAHAEYLKLLRSAVDGKVFDRIDPVYARYCDAESDDHQCRMRQRKLEVYSLRRPIQTVPAGATLRILDERRFEVTWTADGWETKHTTTSRSLGSAGHSADIPAGPDGSVLQWTLRWTEPDSWLGYNVDVKVEINEKGKGDTHS
jgi:glucoamylase